jgi:hypothetical protein
MLPVESPEPKPEHLPDMKVELALQAEAAGRSSQRRRWIMVAGALAFFIFPLPAFISLESMLPVLLMPLGIGACIAFFGMTMTNPRRGITEWGFAIPSKCFAVGMLPYLLVYFIGFEALLAAIVFAVIAWFIAILGSSVTAAIIDRCFYKEE